MSASMNDSLLNKKVFMDFFVRNYPREHSQQLFCQVSFWPISSAVKNRQMIKGQARIKTNTWKLMKDVKFFFL